MDEIPNDQLQLTDIPADDADLDDLIRFAHTFNGYDAFGGFDACADIANAGDHSSLAHLFEASSRISVDGAAGSDPWLSSFA